MKLFGKTTKENNSDQKTKVSTEFQRNSVLAKYLYTASSVA